MNDEMKKYSPVLLRIGLALVFIYFGSQELLHTSVWTDYIPASITDMLNISAVTLVHFNGAFEVVFGSALLLGINVRLSALLLGLHLLDITYIVGYNSIGVRDFGLSVATLAIFLQGNDIFCLENFFSKNNLSIENNK